MQERFIRWTMGIDGRHRDDKRRDRKKEGKIGERAWRFEKRLEAGREEEIARKCWEEMKEIWNSGKIIGTWQQEKEGFMRKRGIKGQQIELEYEEIEERDKIRQMEEK